MTIYTNINNDTNELETISKIRIKAYGKNYIYKLRVSFPISKEARETSILEGFTSLSKVVLDTKYELKLTIAGLQEYLKEGILVECEHSHLSDRELALYKSKV